MRSRLLPLSFGLALAFMLLAWIIFRQRELVIYAPGLEGVRAFAFADHFDGGRSWAALLPAEGVLRFAYRLDSGYAYPYVGLGIELTPLDSSEGVRYLDLSPYDSLRVRLRSSRSEDLRIQITTHDPSYTQADRPLSARYLVSSLGVERSWQVRSLPMASFRIPEWWFASNRLRPDPELRYLERAMQIHLQNGVGIPWGVYDTLEVEEIRLVGENRTLGYALGGGALLLLAAFGVLNWLERERLRRQAEAERGSRREQHLAQAERLEVSSHRQEDARRILDYINKSYANAELDLEQVCREVGINRNRLSAVLKEEVGSTFKGYLVDLRLAEATRILKETDLQVTEVAYKVGFGNVSHFNRVFKERFSITPVEYRRNIT